MNAAIIIARLDSTRFPGKAMTKIGHKTLLEWCFENIIRSKYFIPILATSNRNIDDPLVELVNKLGFDFYRGDFENVALRIKNCIEEKKIDMFARCNADSPFVQAELLDEGYEILLKYKADFVTNLIPRNFPYGMSVEILKSKLFLESFKSINTSKKYQEHITSFFYDNLLNINYQPLPYKYGIYDHDLRLTIDTPEDKEYILSFFNKHENLFKKNTKEIIKIFKGE